MTSPVTIGILLAFSAVTFATAIGWATIALVWRWRFKLAPLTPSLRRMVLAYVRTLPLALVLVLVPTQVVAFLRYESGRAESAGLLLFATAALGASLIVAAALRATRSWYHTARAVALWRRRAIPLRISVWRSRAWTVDVPLPVAVVVGVFRPALFIADQVIARCSEEELLAIVAHETAHANARDNLVKWLFELTPGSTLFPRRCALLEGAWQTASEDAADAAASRETSPLDLAAALLKVARLGGARTADTLAASALIGHRSLRSRIRRLLQAPPDAPRTMRGWVPAAALLAFALVLQLGPAAVLVHEAFELLVRHR
jgi:Zn-dependent protease with chaperone function